MTAGAPRIRPADIKAEPRFSPGARAVLFVTLCWTVPAAVLWASGRSVADAFSQWVMALAAVFGVAVWAAKGTKWKLTPDRLVIRRLGQVHLVRWDRVGALRREPGWPLCGPRWRLQDRDGATIATFTRWTADADRLAALLEFASDTQGGAHIPRA